ncbi:hypothetical protein TSOC_004406 [Tetrabaena socialis]|uniref:Uncharacterized protein n=1 Tax=Tetrabaena socialis TaxID=47790 RepID=A0A2J8A919_9CHLO|nr:hypothetical protein TSOC_004406 [Tetrabaena socialis]|eukprot:PNH08995.1 hypothetical protein TSOC_004406 [Tetrabaena socialis]
MSVLAVAVVALALAFPSPSAAQTVNQNSWSYMLQRNNGQQCAVRYADLIETKYFSADAECRTQVKMALETYSKADCPSTAYPSKVWRCMSGYNGTVVQQARIADWTTFLTSCEVLYIAQRLNTAESEDGFQWRDNSCFPRFNNMAAFVNYLKTTSTTGGDGGGAGSTAVNLLYPVLATLVALLLLR